MPHDLYQENELCKLKNHLSVFVLIVWLEAQNIHLECPCRHYQNVPSYNLHYQHSDNIAKIKVSSYV